MNKNILLKICLIALAFFSVNFSQAQNWSTTGNGSTTVGTNYLGTSDDIDFQINTNASARIRVKKGTGSDAGYVGIATTSPSSVLHIDGTGTPTTTGETFRTNGPSGSTQYWRMYNNGTEIFRIENPSASSSSANLKVIPNAPMRLFTNDIQRIHIDNGNTATQGYVGIGNGFASPASRLHVKQGGSGNDAWFQITSDATGDNATNGLRIGVIDASKNVEIKQQETAPMNFYTSGAARMQIYDAGGSPANGGFVGIGNFGSFTPRNQLHQWITGTTEVFHQFTNGNTGASASTDGFKIGIKYDGSSVSDALLNSQQNGAGMLFNTTNGSGNAERMRITPDGNVGIGTNAPASILHTVVSGSKGTHYASNTFVNSTTSTASTINKYGIDVSSTGSWSGTGSSNYGVHAGSSGAPNNYGCYGKASSSSVNNYGVYGSGNDGTGQNYGLFGRASTPTGANNNYGAYVLAENTGTTPNCYGIKAEVTGGTSINYAVWGVKSVGSCNTTTCVDAAGYFSGDLAYTGTLYEVSDAFLKDNVQSLTGASSILNQLSPKTYTFKFQDYPSLRLNETSRFGLIAEEVEQILPNLVRGFSQPEEKDDQGNIIYSQIDFKALNYTSLIPILIAGFKEQQAQIDALTTQLNGCCPGNRTTGSTPNSGSIELEDMAALQLLQNDPNPFSESTMIRWNLPNDFANAVVYFYDNSGNQINSYKVNSKGAGELQIFGSKLSSGTYTYTLIVDGKMVDSKKMLKSSR